LYAVTKRAKRVATRIREEIKNAVIAKKRNEEE